MRFQAKLVPPGADPESPVRWRLTPSTAELAHRLADELRAAGLVVRDTTEPNGDLDIPESDPQDLVREDVYPVIEIDDGSIGVAVCDGGAFVTADTYRDDEQSAYADCITAVRTAERVTGWAMPPDSWQSLVDEAGYYGVGPDGAVGIPARLTPQELDAEIVELLTRTAGTPDFPRPSALLRSPALEELIALLASVFPDAVRPLTRSYLPHAGGGGYGVRVEPPLDRDPLGDSDEEYRLALRLREELGADDTGRPTQISITLRQDGAPEVAIRFDTLPDSEDNPSPRLAPFGWEGAVVEMCHRQARWIPAWANSACELLRAAGRGI